MKGYAGTTPTVDAIGKLGLTGNVIPRTWLQWLRFDNGKPNSVAIMILAELCYWYRPIEEVNEKTGRVTGWRKKFKADKLQKSYQDLADSLGFTKRQVSDNIKWLKEFGCITTEFRHFSYGSNILFIDLCPDRINQISFSLPDTHVTVEREMGYVETLDSITPERDTYTETTSRDYSSINQVTNQAVNQAHKEERIPPREKNNSHNLLPQGEIPTATSATGKNGSDSSTPQPEPKTDRYDRPTDRPPLHGKTAVQSEPISSAFSPKKEKTGKAGKRKVAFKYDAYGVIQFPEAKRYKLPSILAMRTMQFLLARELECEFGIDKDGDVWISDPKMGDWMLEEEMFGGGSDREQGQLPLKKMVSILNSETSPSPLDIEWYNDTAKRYFEFWQSNCDRLGAEALPTIQRYGSIVHWLVKLEDPDFDIEFEEVDLEEVA